MDFSIKSQTNYVTMESIYCLILMPDAMPPVWPVFVCVCVCVCDTISIYGLCYVLVNMNGHQIDACRYYLVVIAQMAPNIDIPWISMWHQWSNAM